MSEAIGKIGQGRDSRSTKQLAYAPYGQLIKMLLPRSTGVAIYNHAGELSWCSGGAEKPEDQELARRTLSAVSIAAGTGAILTASSGQSAYCARLTDDESILGCVIIELGATRSVWNETVISGLLTPVMRCLEGSLSLEQSLDEPGTQTSSDRDALDLILSVDEDDPTGPSPLHRLLQHSVAHLDCLIGAIVILDKNLIVSCDMDGNETKTSSELLDRTQKNLLAWAQLNNRPMLVNHVAPDTHSDSYKILSCPISEVRGRVNGVIAMFRDSERRDFDIRDVRILEYIARRAIAILRNRHDALTGLVNRAAFERRVQQQLSASPSEKWHAILHVDVDKLQRVNEAFGYQSGDEVIKRLGEAVQSIPRPIDMACRLGGDRVALYIHDRKPEDVERLAYELKAKMARLSYLQSAQAIQLSVSVGVASHFGPCRLTQLLAAAELSCKEAKAQGRNSVVVAAHKDQEVARHPNGTLVSINLRHALANNEFWLEALPMQGLAISPGEIMGHEVLLRLRDADGKLVAPDKFLEIAERYNLLAALDRWTISNTVTALQEARVSFANRANLVTFNISGQALTSVGFADFILEELLHARLPAPAFRFEIKESAAVKNPSAAESFIRKLRDAGAQVGIDDFGVGVASFAGLKNLPIQYLKIDGSLIRRVLEDPEAEATVRGIVKAAEIFGIFTIAEHVESREMADKLQALDVSFGQGFYFGRPKPLSEAFV